MCCHVTWCSIVQHVDASGTRVRGESHLLLVGDPGIQRGHVPTLIRSLVHIVERFHCMYSVNPLCVIFCVSY